MKKSHCPKDLFQYYSILDGQKWNLDGISFPISFTEIKNFFNQNETLKYFLILTIYLIWLEIDSDDFDIKSLTGQH